MKRLALAAALAGLFATSAFAQSSNVTIYGRMNTTIEHMKVGDGESQGQMVNNASRLGFKGSEDLGGGLKANFLLEHRLGSDDGTVTGDFWSGDSWVGLSGNFGEIRLGRQTSAAYYATADYVSLHNHDTGTSADALYSLGFQSWATDNKFSYITPSFGGAVGEVQYGFGEGGEQSLDLAVNYAVGPLQLGAGYTKVAEDTQFALRGLYTIGDFTFGGYYQRASMDETFADDGDSNIFRLSGMYVMGASEFHLNVGLAGDVGDTDDSGAKQYTLAYNYNLSKRTKVYAFATKISADSANPYTDDFRSFALGLRHNF